MDQALDIRLLTDAVGYHERLPDPEELRRLLAETEARLFIQQGQIEEAIVDTGWYLQAVATARPDLRIYDLPRQRQAHQVSGHIFDLALQSTDDLTLRERLRLTFAAQIGYLGGDLTPNASALARRAPLPESPFEWSEPGQMSLEVGVLALALDRAALSPLLEARLDQLSDLQSEIGTLARTPFAAVHSVISGARDLIAYLTQGDRANLDQAQRHFSSAINTEAARSDIDSRWVAVHLRRTSSQLSTTSAWAALPPDRPSIAQAMTLGDPPVLSLWPPQLSFLSSSPSPLDPEVRRVALSFPTSAGKTLLAQILIVAHVASTESGDVCVVAPTHSLCRELGHSLERRLRILGSDLFIEGPLGFEQLIPPTARVSVMTPEKLAALLRSDPARLLKRYTMFVIDEAHLVAAPNRGWRLEETLSMIHHLTVDTAHRILVLSAVLGNQSHVIQWIAADDERPVAHHTDWRGPRRLNAVYTTRAEWGDLVEIPPRGSRLARQQVPLHGEIRLSTGIGKTRVPARIVEPVGTLVRRRKKDGEWVNDRDSTTERKQLVPLIRHVSRSGPVLVVQPTRSEAQRLAIEVADGLGDEYATVFSLRELVSARLTEDHPLTRTLDKGVAFHHAALPIDIQAEIENAVRAGYIRVLIGTSTLIEGVNLPFKTVIVGRRGWYSPEGDPVQAIDPAGLLNAVGRAGRAGRETEGWMILAEMSAPYNNRMFDPLERTGEDLEILSTIRTEEALRGLSTFEELSRTTQDAIFRNYDDAADGFLGFVWFIAQALEDLELAVSTDDVLAVIKRTLAWQQLDTEQRSILVRVAEVAYAAFESQPPDRRSRWSRSGATLPTNQALETVAERLLARCDSDPTLDLDDLQAATAAVLDDETLNMLLELPENPRRGFKPYRTAPRDKLVNVNLRELLLDWVAGIEIRTLANRHLTAIKDKEYRSEALADYVTNVFGHHLPWTLGIVLQWANIQIEANNGRRIPEHLPLAIHYGVSNRTALNLMQNGIRSRRLAKVVAAYADGKVGEGVSSLREWLAEQTIAYWREHYSASSTEIADLLRFTRSPGSQLVSSVLEGSAHELAINTTGHPTIDTPGTATLEAQTGIADPAPIQVVTPAGVVGTVGSADHDEVTQCSTWGCDSMSKSYSPQPELQRSSPSLLEANLV